MFSSWSRTGKYDLLPGHDSDQQGGRVPFSFRASRLLNRRANIGIVVVLLASSIITVVYLLNGTVFFGDKPAEVQEGPEVLPPLYREFRQAELALPQHSWEDSRDAFAGGKKYLWIAGHTHSSGFGNFMQDMVMNAQLTYATGRGYVFDNFTWDRDGPDYAEWGGKKIPSRIPLSALISGPIVGGELPPGDQVPRAIRKEYFDRICPTKTIVHPSDVRKIFGDGATAVKIIDTWINYLRDITDPCVEVDRESNIFHIFMFGTPSEILPAWPMLSRSPIMQLTGWGSLAHSAFEVNRHLFSPAPLIEPYTTTSSCLHCVDPYAPLPGLVALHLRRGDFIQHCENLGHWGAGFQAFCSFPEFPDLWVSPEGNDDEKIAHYLKRCLPTVEQIIEKLTIVRKSRGGDGLKHIHIMSNGDREWLADLKRALAKMGVWELISTSRDFELTLEQKYTSHTLDMLIGQRAQVFIGNGFSSMTSNIALLRQIHQVPPETTRMW